MGEVTASSGCLLRRFPVSILRPVVEGDGTLGFGRERSKSADNRRLGGRSRLGSELCDEHQSRLPFHERIDAGSMVSRLHRV